MLYEVITPLAERCIAGCPNDLKYIVLSPAKAKLGDVETSFMPNVNFSTAKVYPLSVVVNLRALLLFV